MVLAEITGSSALSGYGSGGSLNMVSCLPANGMCSLARVNVEHRRDLNKNFKSPFPQERRYDWTGRLSNVRGVGPESVKLSGCLATGFAKYWGIMVSQESAGRGGVSAQGDGADWRGIGQRSGRAEESESQGQGLALLAP